MLNDRAASTTAATYGGFYGLTVSTLEWIMKIVTIKGFSPRRMAYIIAVMIYCLLPIHGYVPCHVSGQIGMASFILMILVGVLCMMDKEIKYLPFVMALIGAVANSLFTH